MRCKRAFTLIELLVVIAIIAVLMGVLMPSLRAARELARGSSCLANERSLIFAYTMYADDNDGRLVRGHVNQTGLDTPMWVLPPITEAGAYASGPVALSARIRGIERGALFPYIRNTNMYHCPGDDRFQSAATLDQAMYRSYMVPDVLSAADSGFHAWTENRYQYLPRKLIEIKQASRKYIFLESEFQNTSFNYDHGAWSFAPWIDDRWVDSLATFHSKSANFSFADGHGEKHKWVHMETWQIFKQDTMDMTFDPPKAENEDVRWCWEHFPYLSESEKLR